MARAALAGDHRDDMRQSPMRVRLPRRSLDHFDTVAAVIRAKERAPRGRSRDASRAYSAIYAYAVMFGLDTDLLDRETRSAVLDDIRAALVAAVEHGADVWEA